MSIIIIGSSFILSLSFDKFDNNETDSGLLLFVVSAFFSVAMSFSFKHKTLLKSFFGISLSVYTLALISLIRMGVVGPGFIILIMFIFVMYFSIIYEYSYYE